MNMKNILFNLTLLLLLYFSNLFGIMHESTIINILLLLVIIILIIINLNNILKIKKTYIKLINFILVFLTFGVLFTKTFHELIFFPPNFLTDLSQGEEHTNLQNNDKLYILNYDDGGKSGGKSLVKKNGNYTAEDLVPQNIQENEWIYANLSKKDAAFARAMIYPILVLVLGISILLLSYFFQ